MALWYKFVFSPESRAPPYTQGDDVAPELEAFTPEPVTDKKKRARPESPLEVDPDEAVKKAARRELQLLWTRLKSTKDKYSNALAAFHGVDTSIRTDDAWAWATGVDAKRLAAAREELSDTLNRSEFWRRWSVMDTASLRKEFSDSDEVKNEGRSVEEITNKIAKLDRLTRGLLAQQKLRGDDI